MANVFLKRPLELGRPNTLVCMVGNIFPPAVTIGWQRDGVPVTDGVTDTTYTPVEDLGFVRFSYLEVTPRAGDVYSCIVTRERDNTSVLTYWGEWGPPFGAGGPPLGPPLTAPAVSPQCRRTPSPPTCWPRRCAALPWRWASCWHWWGWRCWWPRIDTATVRGDRETAGTVAPPGQWPAGHVPPPPLIYIPPPSSRLSARRGDGAEPAARCN